VRKTGGNSIQSILRAYSEDEVVALTKHQDGNERFAVKNNKYATTKHATLSRYKSVIEPDIYQSLFKFATLRNPWDMMISFYFSPHRGFTAWDRNRFLTLLHRVKNIRHYICNGMQSLNIDAELDYLMKFEQLSEDFGMVCKHLGIANTPLPKKNQSTRKHYSKYYDSELIKMVENKFNEEIEFGDYRFEKA
jgi:hypothetical protein